MCSAFACLGMLAACRQREPASSKTAASGDAEFQRVASAVLDATFRFQPTNATYLGIHTYDDKIEDYSRQGVAAELDADRKLRAQVSTIDPSTLGGWNIPAYCPHAPDPTMVPSYSATKRAKWHFGSRCSSL